MRLWSHRIIPAALMLLVSVAPAMAQQAKDEGRTPAETAQAAIDRGIAYLKTMQNPDGGWQANEQQPPAISAIVLMAIVQDEKYDANTDFVKKGYEKLLSFQMEDGGIYKDLLANYNTAIAVAALSAAENPEYRPRIDAAVNYLRQLQWTDASIGPKGERVIEENAAWEGGWGYGRHGRPDMSNAQLALDALHASGLPPEDPAFQNALKFITRSQNLSETNDQPWASNDGGFIYTPARNGESAAGEYNAPGGGGETMRRLHSYGSMTYAGLKSMIYAGLTRDDPRVKGAWDWITRNWTLDENPGMRLGDPAKAENGLYYYYMTLGRALDVYNQPILTDSQGNEHDWRVELIDAIVSRQHEDGSWVGVERWMETNPVLVTSYAILALQNAQNDLKEHPAK